MLRDVFRMEKGRIRVGFSLNTLTRLADGLGLESTLSYIASNLGIHPVKPKMVSLVPPFPIREFGILIKDSVVETNDTLF